MQFDPNQLSAMEYANSITWWSYRFEVPHGNPGILPEDFFSPYYMHLRPGDLIFVSRFYNGGQQAGATALVVTHASQHDEAVITGSLL